MGFVSASMNASTKSVNTPNQVDPFHICYKQQSGISAKRDAINWMARAKAKGNSGTGNRTLGSAELISQVMRARNVSHYTIPELADELLETDCAIESEKWYPDNASRLQAPSSMSQAEYLSASG